MEKSAIRMIAKMVSVNKIEVQLIRRYYEGNCPRFYLRDLNNNTFVNSKIKITKKVGIIITSFGNEKLS